MSGLHIAPQTQGITYVCAFPREQNLWQEMLELVGTMKELEYSTTDVSVCETAERKSQLRVSSKTDASSWDRDQNLALVLRLPLQLEVQYCNTVDYE